VLRGSLQASTHAAQAVPKTEDAATVGDDDDVRSVDGPVVQHGAHVTLVALQSEHACV
jgi:hypothetical protein